MARTAMTDLNTYRQKIAGLPADRFIGSILWFTISGAIERLVSTAKRTVVPVRVSRDQLEAWFTELNLDTKFLPAVIKKIDAFRVASSETLMITPLTMDTEEKLFTKEIDSNPEFVLRHVHREITNKRTQTTTYAHVATIKFLRGARSASGKRHSSERYEATILTTLVELGLNNKPTGKKYRLQGADKARVAQFMSTFETRYTDLAANLTSQAIRGMIRNYLTSLNAISVKPSGGVYFVHSSRQITVNALEELVRRLGPGCALHQMPLVDTEEQRDMLTDAFQSEIEDECTSLLRRLIELQEVAKNKGGNVNANQIVALKAEWDALAARSTEYTEVLGLAQGRTGAAMDLALESIVGLYDHLPKGKKR